MLDFGMKPRIVLSNRAPVNDYGTPASGIPGRGDFRVRRWCGREEPDLVPLLRTMPAATVERGPLILAKSVKLGEGATDILATCGINEGGWNITAEPLTDAPAWGAWRLDFERGGARRAVKACDYSSAAAWTMDKIEFSIFF